MSRIGKQPIPIPSGVKVAIANRLVQVEGPKGKLALTHHEAMKVGSDGKDVEFARFMDLPSCTTEVLEVAIAGAAPRDRIAAAGWHVREGHAVSATMVRISARPRARSWGSSGFTNRPPPVAPINSGNDP